MLTKTLIVKVAAYNIDHTILSLDTRYSRGPINDHNEILRRMVQEICFWQVSSEVIVCLCVLRDNVALSKQSFHPPSQKQ